MESLSVVLPAADEAATVPRVIARLREALEGLAKRLEILVVVPRPEDPTFAAARSAGARVLVQKRPGYGGALKEGLRAAGGDWVVTMDADGSHPPEQIPRLLARRDEAEVIVGSRWVDAASAEMPLHRRVLSRLLNAVYARFLAVPVRDTSSGFRLYKRSVLDELELVGENYDVLQEILVQLYARGWQVLETPLDYGPRLAGTTHARPLGFAPHYLASFWRLFKMRNSHEAADYDSRAYDSVVLPQRYWQRRRYAIVTRMVDGATPRLDVGCGSSRIIQAAPDCVGLDYGIAKLRFLRRTNRLLARGDTVALPFPDGHFRAVVHSQVIEHVPYDRRIFTELNRVLAPGGTLVIGTPDYGRVQWRWIERLYMLLMPNAYGDDHITHYSRHTLTEELAEAGFAVQEYDYVLGGELIMRCVKREELPVEPGRERSPERPG